MFPIFITVNSYPQDKLVDLNANNIHTLDVVEVGDESSGGTRLCTHITLVGGDSIIVAQSKRDIKDLTKRIYHSFLQTEGIK